MIPLSRIPCNVFGLRRNRWQTSSLLDNTRFRLNIVRNNRKVLRYLEEHHINTELYGEIVLHYTPLSKPQLETLSAVVLRLFFGELLF